MLGATTIRYRMMTREQISNEVKLLLVEGWDSLTHMSLITAVEDRYGFRFKLKELNQLKTVGSLIDLVEAKQHV